MLGSLELVLASRQLIVAGPKLQARFDKTIDFFPFLRSGHFSVHEGAKHASKTPQMKLSMHGGSLFTHLVQITLVSTRELQGQCLATWARKLTNSRRL